jgi:hypothetical protein
MTIQPIILSNNQIKDFETYSNNFNKYVTIEKILKIVATILIVFSVSILLSSFIFDVSSMLLFSCEITLSASYFVISIGQILLKYFQSKIKRPNKITIETLIDSLKRYNDKFLPLNKNKYNGKIEKIDLEKGSKLILKADLHGDYFSLIEMLRALQKQGYLDENFNVKKEYKEKIIIAFLGDYIDRGENSFEIINLLAKLKINNPNEIILLKGNHEDLNISKYYINDQEKHFYQNEQLCENLDKFFSSLPLAVLIGCKDENKKYQYTCLSHGAFDPDIDINKVLQKRSSRAVMYIKKDKKACLSKRLLNVLPKHLRNKDTKEIRHIIQALENYISEQSPFNLIKLKTFLKIQKIDKKKAKQILSILKVQDFLTNPNFLKAPTNFNNYNSSNIAQYIENYRKEENSSFCWGDISKNLLGLNTKRGIALSFTPEFTKDYFRAISTENAKVKTLRAGHAHFHRKFSINGKKAFIEILPVAGELNLYDTLRLPLDISEKITISPKVKNWTNQLLIRKRADTNTLLSEEKSFYFAN